MKKYLITICPLLLGIFAMAQVVEPNEVIIDANEKADVVVEAKTIKRDTLNISEKESYLIYTIENIQVFKGELNSKTFKLKIKRDFCEEQGLCHYAHGGTWKPALGAVYIHFLIKEKHKNSKILTYTNYGEIRFTLADHNKYKAHGFQLHFKSLLELYSFLPKLKGVTVPKCYLDSARYAKPPEKDIWKDSTFLKMLEERKKGRKEAMEKERIRIEHLMKIMKENKKSKSKTQKGDTGTLPMAAPTLAIIIIKIFYCILLRINLINILS